MWSLLFIQSGFQHLLAQELTSKLQRMGHHAQVVLQAQSTECGTLELLSMRGEEKVNRVKKSDMATIIKLMIISSLLDD